jgi:hypothetical protein
MLLKSLTISALHERCCPQDEEASIRKNIFYSLDYGAIMSHFGERLVVASCGMAAKGEPAWGKAH